MPRRGGLGPRGHEAIQRAVKEAETHARIHATRSTRTINSERPGEEEQEADLTWVPMESSRISEAAYDREHNNLYLRFMRPAPGVDEYVYNGVTPNQWRNFRRSPSAGRYVNKVLNQLDYHRVR